jgi:hypothetical protein
MADKINFSSEIDSVFKGLRVFAIFAVAFFLLAGVVAAQTPISSCQTITASGSYILTNDITTTGNCIFIAADNVVLDCNGAVIKGPGKDAGNLIGIAGGWGAPGSAINTTIKNCIIDGFNIGIRYVGSQGTNATIINNTLRNNNHGTYIDGTFGSLINNTYINNSVAIYSNWAKNVIGNRFQYNTYEITGSIPEIVSDNVLLDSCKVPQPSMYVFNFHSNVPFCPGQYNFTGNALFIVNNNVTLDCNGAVIKGPGKDAGNFFGITGGWGAPGSAINTTIKNCIIDNFRTGLNFITDRAQNLTIINNTIRNTLIGVNFDRSDTRILNNTFENNTYAITPQYQYGIVIGNKFKSNTYEISGNIPEIVSDNVLLDSCKVPQPSMYVFNFHSNVPFCPGQYNFTGNALFIVNNNVTLDCNGAVIKGPGKDAGNFFGITGGWGAPGSAINTTIKNCIIDNFRTGLNFITDRAQNLTIINNTIRNTLIGVNFDRSDTRILNNTFENNTYAITPQYQYGIVIGNKFKSNTYEISGNIPEIVSDNVLLDSCKVPQPSMYVFNFHSNVPFCPGQYNFTGNALFIVNNNVTLDCNGAVIKGPGKDAGNFFGITGGWGAPGSAINTTIKNCIIDNFRTGLNFITDRAQNLTIINNTIRNTNRS